MQIRPISKTEPDVTEKALTWLEYVSAMNWYSYEKDATDARTYLQTYFEEDTERLNKISKLSEDWIPTTAAWIARLVSNGAILKQSSVDFIDKQVDDNYKKYLKIHPPVVEKKKRKDSSNEFLIEIEKLIDENQEIDTDALLTKYTPSLSEGEVVIAYYAPLIDELLQVLEKKDPQLKEAYSFLSNEDILKRILFYNSLLESVEKYISSSSVGRKPRKPKEVSPEKMVRFMEPQAECAEFGLKSIKPEKIVGASELWSFSTKYKTLSVFRAKDDKGLQVYRTAIQNYDEKTSKTYRIGRNTQTILKKVLETTKVGLRKVMEDAGTEIKLTERINENTILLRVVG